MTSLKLLSFAAISAFAFLSAGQVLSSPLCNTTQSVSGLNVILAAGASQCDTSCMTKYDTCVSKGLAAQTVPDDELVYEACSADLSSCRDACINQGACINDDSGFVICP